ncbi:MAG: Rrf2 family transcriptional regulator [Bacteroidales bacterium]|jgi:Rrf2 family protein|nr:Rrf2 family transcriptional regulator [Bacteroidales bacterium]HOL97692.1 Rrf2 family transcriptional regulator [Bacteroidales bacterium]HOM37419.1 Rrf2 family transcriptional regulator [Bacteroidales bacterium]HPD24924.1 Rrf2 family transcriptional regulator [Bacteroidales bacterium]HRT00648.1 Rrf2 family transcriptional regulator [Bacteroidales bacterium]
MSFVALKEANILAIHGMALISAAGEQGISARKIEKITKCSINHLFKVLELLEKFGYLNSKKGPHGGYALNKPANEITLIELVEIISGKFDEEIECFVDNRKILNKIVFGNLCHELTDYFISYLKTTKISDLTPHAKKILDNYNKKERR